MIPPKSQRKELNIRFPDMNEIYGGTAYPMGKQDSWLKSNSKNAYVNSTNEKKFRANSANIDYQFEQKSNKVENFSLYDHFLQKSKPK